MPLPKTVPFQKTEVWPRILKHLKSLKPPVLTWGRQYNLSKLKSDCIAGVTVGVMLVPQGLAYAVLAGLPAVYGLYASVVPPLAYALLGTSQQLSVGPVAVTGLLTASALEVLGPADQAQYVSWAAGLSLLMGLVAALMGLLNFGFIVNFFSHTVLTAFISAAAVVILVSQVKDLLGLQGVASAETVAGQLLAIGRALPTINPYSVLFSALSILLLLKVKPRLPRWVPLELLLMAVACLGTWGLGLAGLHLVPVNAGQAAGFPAPRLPGLPPLGPGLLQAALLAIVSYIGGIALAKGLAFKHGYEISANLELLGLGAANIAGAFFSGHPVSASFSRSAVANEMGAASPVAGIVTGLVVLLFLLALTPLLSYLPRLVLAALVAVSTKSLLDTEELLYLWRVDRLELGVYVATFLSTVLFGISQGVLFSVVLSLVLVVWATSRPKFIELGRLPGTVLYRSLKRYPAARLVAGTVVIRVDAALFFGNISRFKDGLYQVLLSRQPRAIILDASAVNGVDSSALHVLDQIHQDFAARGVHMVWAGSHGYIRDRLLACLQRPPLFYYHLYQAVEAFKQGLMDNASSVGERLVEEVRETDEEAPTFDDSDGIRQDQEAEASEGYLEGSGIFLQEDLEDTEEPKESSSPPRKPRLSRILS